MEEKDELDYVAPSARASRPEDKAQDDRDFKARWIAYGMMLKGKADGYGIKWQGKDFQTWMHEITDAEVWHQMEDKCVKM